MSSVALTRQAPYPVRVQQRRCGKCGKLVSRSAYACRRCGKSQRIRPRTILLCLSAGLMIGMFAVASAGALLPPAHPADPQTAAAASVVRAPVAAVRASEINASDLWLAYSRD